MISVIHCLDDPTRPGLRDSYYKAHLDYLATQTDVHLVMTGPLFDAGAEHRIGSLLVVEAESLDAVRHFSARDPFTTNGVFAEVRINPFRIANQNPLKAG